jgi:molybdate transport system substrate-binding protein
VYAAASLKEAITELNAVFERDHDAKIELNAGSSGTLSSRSSRAKSATSSVSARRQGDGQARRPRPVVDKPTRRTCSRTSSWIVVPKGEEAVKKPEDLKGDAVQAPLPGHRRQRARRPLRQEWLTKADLWTAVEARCCPATTCARPCPRSSSAAPSAGIVYRTDAALSEKVSIAYAVPLKEGPKISYPIAAMAKRPNGKAGRRVRHLPRSDKAKEVFQRYGFLLPEAARKRSQRRRRRPPAPGAGGCSSRPCSPHRPRRRGCRADRPPRAPAAAAGEVAFLVLGEHVGRFAQRAGHAARRRRQAVLPERRDAVVGAVHRRAHEVVEAGVDQHELVGADALLAAHLAHEHAALRGHVAPRLDLQARARRELVAQRAPGAGVGRDVELGLARAVGMGRPRRRESTASDEPTSSAASPRTAARAARGARAPRRTRRARAGRGP